MNDNKLIAEFMGVQYKSDEDYFKELKEMREDGIFYEQGYMESQLNYHTSWDWLMPVVEKIEEDGYGFERNKQEDGDWQCLITKGYDIVYQKFADCSIDATYDAVVEFIKQHNKQNN